MPLYPNTAAAVRRSRGRSRRWIVLTCLALGLVLAAPVPAAPVAQFQLDNGLKVVVRPDRRAPVVISQIWYKVGSSYEPGGITGVSHVLEHMMFKGTENLEPGEFSRTIAALGGTENAFTSRDYTGYYQQLAREQLEASFRLEAERMAGLRLEPEAFAKEVRVVMEERRLRTEDSPEALTHELLNATAYLTSPYRQPVIGWMQDLEALELVDLQRWYRQWYAPNNATVVVVGDVDPAAVRKLAQTHFGPLQPATVPAARPGGEVAQRGEKRVEVRAPAELPYVLMGYKVPVLRTAAEDWEPYALEMAAGVLSTGSSARLARRLERDSRVAASASAGYSLDARLDALFLLAGNPAPGRSAAELEAALRAEVARLREEPVAVEELQRVRAQVIAADVYRRDSMFYQAMRIGVLETVGLGWEVMEDYVDRIEAVTPEQVQAVARRYLVDPHLTVATLVPENISVDAPPAPATVPQAGEPVAD